MPKRRSLRGQEEASAESHQHIATEQELKVAKKAREHLVEVEEEAEVGE